MTQAAPTAFETYAQALDYLFTRTDYERMARVRHHAGSYDLGRMQRLCDALGRPQDNFASVHVAGTIAKGSVAAMTAYLAAGGGKRVGLYISPHLVDIRERIVLLERRGGRVVEEPISEAAFVAAMNRVAPALDRLADDPPTFFELMTAVAFVALDAMGVDLAVLEVGLGGRLDATNVVTPRAAAITPIGMDHMRQLGNTIESIAGEKAAIIKPGVPAVSAPQRPAAGQVIARFAREQMAPLLTVGREISLSTQPTGGAGPRRWRAKVATPSRTFDEFIVPLLGRHQAVSAAVALGLVDQLLEGGWSMDLPGAMAGLEQARWPGRLDLRGRRPWIVLDGAHTVEALRAVLRALPETFDYRRLIVVAGCLADKDRRGLMGALANAADIVVATQSDHPHRADPASLLELLAILGPSVRRYLSLSAPMAMDMALNLAGPNDMVLVTGSLYLVGLVMKLNAEAKWFAGE
ncbi:MAG: Folylpolyglutamate synthase [Phycisphaerae bacterium]|nr:Folylpolyglutamate synthase [Phycisphaerae bacterium]